MLDAITQHLNLTPEEIHNHPELMINAFDHEHRILLWNKKCEEYFGISKDEALGKKIEDILPYLRGHEKMAHLQRALGGRPMHVLKEEFDLRKGSYEQKVIPVKDSAGQVIAALNLVRSL